MTQPHSNTPWWGNSLDGLPSSFTLRLAKFQQLARSQFDAGVDYGVFHRTVLVELFDELFTPEAREQAKSSPAYASAVKMCNALMSTKPCRKATREPIHVLFVRVPKSLAESHSREASERRVSINALAIAKLNQPLPVTNQSLLEDV